MFLDFPLSEDDAISSFQAKYVKFLQFLREDRFEWFKNYDEIVYVDHKFFLTTDHLGLIETNKEKEIMIRTTPRLKTTVWDEVNDAMGQERYRRFMLQTRAYIDEKIKSGLSENARICNTGLISYSHNNPDVLSFVNHIYPDLVEIGTSECQIVWALISQQYLPLIQTIDWADIPILWKAPS